MPEEIGITPPQPELKKPDQAPQPISEGNGEYNDSEPKENKLSSKLKSVQADSKDRIQKISTLANLASVSETAPTLQKPVSFETMSLEIDSLSKTQGLSNSEYIAKSSQIVASAGQFITQVQAEVAQ